MIEFLAGVVVGVALMSAAVVSYVSKPKNARYVVARLASKGYRA